MSVALKIDLDDARRAFVALVAIQALLLMMHLAVAVVEAGLGQPPKGHFFVDMDQEGNLPTWFAGAQLFTIGMLAMLIARLRDFEAPPSRTFFVVAGLLFIFLSMDETAAFHEKITLATKHVEWVPHFPGHRGVWAFLYLPFGLILVIAARRDVLALWQRYRSDCVLLSAGILTFLVGAAAFDIFAIYVLPGREPSFLYQLQVAGEESLEMLGANLAIWAGLRLLVRISSKRGTAVPSS